MAGKIASIARRIMYTHVPKDGKTPVYNAAVNKWDFLVNPTEAQLTSSVARLSEVDSRSVSAIAKADSAKQVADSKVTADEAVEKVKESLFFITRREAAGAIGGNKLRLELLEDDQENWTLRVHASRGASSGDPTVYTLPLDYITREEYVDLLMRLVAIEQRLGIS